ncbi:MAG: glycine cleavage system protein GcvH [Coriobacteriia bacterium]|nr:glycine cleavage system protein GcvH [Coriobacteriia bacterium]
MSTPDELYYTNDHEWVRIESDSATVGITDFAQDQLGGLVFVNLPAPGEGFVAGEVFGEVESVKSVSELLAPLAGEVTEVNAELEGAPETINNDPYGAGWIIKIKLSDPAQVGDLLDADAYASVIA